MVSKTLLDARIGLLGLDPAALQDELRTMDEAGYRANQVAEWIYKRGVSSFDEMTNLSLLLRRKLNVRFSVFQSRVVRESNSTDGTSKLLLEWQDGGQTECVLIPDGDRRTACVSTQVGCPVKCVFCASGLDGLERHLTTAQIVEQALRLARFCDARRLSHIVFMGVGEPLHNFDATVSAARILNAEWGLGIGARRITISTVGLPKQIVRLADEGEQFNLAISLHAPNDALRAEIIPWAVSIKIDDLVAAARYFFDQTGREVTLEYVLLAEVNDGVHHAAELAQVAGRMRCNVNLIRYNPVEGLPFGRPRADKAARFQQTLRRHGINVHMRRSRGRDIDGACGQLRRRHQNSSAPEHTV